MRPELPVSTSEWMPSEIITVLRVSAPTTNLVAAMPRLAMNAPTRAFFEDAGTPRARRPACRANGAAREADCLARGGGSARWFGHAVRLRSVHAGLWGDPTGRSAATPADRTAGM